jgi:ribosomal protein S18 acetylase RimI-like enzyme
MPALTSRIRRSAMTSVNDIVLRRPESGDYAFALGLYLETMKPYAAELMVWEDAKQTAGFATQWKPEDVRIVVVDGEDVGWLQIADRDSEIFLQQFFVRPSRQRSGIGSTVLAHLVASWEISRKPVVLTVLKNNPARRLYEKFDFVEIAEEGVKYRMERRPKLVPVGEKATREMAEFGEEASPAFDAAAADAARNAGFCEEEIGEMLGWAAEQKTNL